MSADVIFPRERSDENAALNLLLSESNIMSALYFTSALFTFSMISATRIPSSAPPSISRR